MQRAVTKPVLFLTVLCLLLLLGWQRLLDRSDSRDIEAVRKQLAAEKEENGRLRRELKAQGLQRANQRDEPPQRSVRPISPPPRFTEDDSQPAPSRPSSSGGGMPKYHNFCEERVAEEGPVVPDAEVDPATLNPFPDTCDSAFADAQFQVFQERVQSGRTGFELPVYCQEHTDVLEVYAKLSPDPNKVIFEIGANKGYDIVEFYRHFSNFPVNLVWYNTRLHPGCPWGYDQSRHVFPRVFAFEPQQNTNAVLHELAAQLPLCNLRLEMIALSNTTGEQPFPVAAAGDESATLFRSKPEAGQEFYMVPVETVDAYAARHGVKHIHYMNIDTEGNDWRVMDGMRRLLEDGRVDVFSFERGRLEERTLQQQVEKLDDLGYDCFLLVYKALLKLNGGCWRGSYELSAISNTLCVRKKYKLHDALLSPFNAVSAGTGSGGSSRASAAGKRARGQQQRDRLDEW